MAQRQDETKQPRWAQESFGLRSAILFDRLGNEPTTEEQLEEKNLQGSQN